MKPYKLAEDVRLIGVQVKTFPVGIKEAFGSLVKTFGSNRDYYGVSWMDKDDSVKYFAMTSAAFSAEEEQQDYERLTVRKGDYQTEAVHNWLSKTDCIKDVFHQLMGNNKPDENRPCIEWYQSDEEMLCMIRML